MAIRAMFKSWFSKKTPTQIEPSKYQSEQLAKESKIQPSAAVSTTKESLTSEVKKEIVSTGHPLTDVVFNSTQLSISLIALNKIEDQAMLADIITKHSIVKIRLEAAKKLSQPELIASLAQKTKQSDKGVYRILREKLDLIATSTKANEQQQQQLEKICTDLEALHRGSLNPLFAAKVKSLEQQWQQLQSQDGSFPELVQRYQLAAEAVNVIIATQQQQQLAESTAKRQQQDVLAQLASLVEKALALTVSEQSLISTINTLQATWQQTLTIAPPPSAEEKQVHALLQQLTKLAVLTTFASEHESQLSQLTQQLSNDINDKAAYSSLQQLVKPLALHKYTELPTLFTQIQTLLTQAEKATISIKEATKTYQATSISPQQLEFDAIIGNIELAINEGHSREASQLLRNAQQLAKQHRLYDPRLTQWAQELQQLKDWAGFAIIPKKEALVAKMAQLAAQDDDDGLARLNDIKALQAEWQDIGMVNNDSEKALWQQFKELSQQAYLPCQRYFDEQKALQANNAQHRQALCNELQQYIDLMPSEVNWQGHVAILKKARDDWQSYHPVDAKVHKKLQGQFNSIIKVLEDKLHAEYQQQEARKHAIINEAEQLLALEDIRLACQKAKDLQQQWKATGSCGHAKDQALWEVFRRHCDAVFSKREQYKQSRQQQEAEDIATAQQLQTELTTLLNQAWSTELDTTLHDINQRFQALNLPRELYQSVRKQIADLYQQGQIQQTQAADAEKTLQMNQVLVAIDLCLAAEKLVLAGTSLSDDLQRQWSTLTFPPFFEPLLQKRWQQIALSSPTAAEPSWLEVLLEVDSPERLLALTSAFKESCLWLELLLDVDSPSGEQAARTAKKLQLFQQQSYPKTDDDKNMLISQHLTQVLLTVGLPDSEDIYPRLKSILQHASRAHLQ